MDALGGWGNVYQWHSSLTLLKALAQATCWTSDPMRETVVGFTHFVQIFQGMFFWGLIIDPSHVPSRWKYHPQGPAVGDGGPPRTWAPWRTQGHTTEPEEHTVPSGAGTRHAVTGLLRDSSRQELQGPAEGISTGGKGVLTLLSDPPEWGTSWAIPNPRIP